jgi:uncharacterized protein (TIGR02594 family)
MRKELKANQIMLLTLMEHYGLREIPGVRSDPTILSWFKRIGHEWADDEVAWCGCAIAWAAEINGIERSKELTARSWLKIGKETTEPEVGDIVVFWRGKTKNSWKGHVGLFMGFDGDQILCFSGNQSNQLNIKPYHKDRLLEYRKLAFIKKPSKVESGT